MRLLLCAAAAAVMLASTGLAQDAKTKDKDGDKESMKKEPEITEIAGKTLEQWVKEISTRDPSKRDLAVRTVVLFGPDRAYALAVPALLAELRKHSASTPIDLSVRISAPTSLATILSGAKEPNPIHVRDAVVILRRLCKDEQAMVRVRAAQALSQLGPEARNALPEMIGVAQDRDTWEARQAGVQALAVMGTMDPSGAPPAAIAAIYRALNDSSMQVRLAAVQALARLGPFADMTTQGAMIRHLETAAAKDTEPGVQLWAHMGMMTIKKAPLTEHLAPVTKLLRHPDVSTRVQAAQALGMIGPPAKSAIPTLISTLGDPDANVVGNSIIALVQIDATGAVPALQRLAKDPLQNDAVKKAAAGAADHLSKKKTGDTKTPTTP